MNPIKTPGPARLAGAVNPMLRLGSTLLMLLSLSHCAQFAAPPAEPTPEPAVQQPAESVAEQNQSVVQPSTDSSPVEPQPAQPVRPTLAPELQSQFQQATRLMRAEGYQAALSMLEPLARAMPEAAGIQYNLAFCYWQLKQTEQARQHLTSLLQYQPDYVEAANLLGVIARQEGNFNQARRHWLDALAQRSDFASAHKNLGFLYELYLAQPEQARYHYQQYQQLTGDPMAEAWLSLLQQPQE